MQITPVDIRGKTFRRAFRGYDPQDVDKFLESISQEFEKVYGENFELKEKIGRLQTELDHYKSLENTLQQTMVLAQQTAEEVKQAAQREAELILRQAEEENRRKLSETQEKWAEIQEEIQGLLRKRELIRTQLKAFLHAHLDLAASFENDKEIS